MKLRMRWQVLALLGLALLGLALRLYGINWDVGNNFHPDERQILFQVTRNSTAYACPPLASSNDPQYQLRQTLFTLPSSLAQFFDPARSPLNPHFFAYGTFPLYLLALLANFLIHFFPTRATFLNLTLMGRFLSALFDAGSILLTAWLGFMLAEDNTPQHRRAWAMALLAAALMLFVPLSLQLSHFYAVDTLLNFFIVLTILGCVALVQTEKIVRWSLVIGLGYGLALATKFSAAPLAIPVLVAVILRWYRRDLVSALVALLIATLSTLVVFFLAMPYAFIDYATFVSQVTFQGDLARGLIDLPYVRQFAGTTPYVYEAQNMFFWGMGVTLFLASALGCCWVIWRVARRRADLWLIVLSWMLVYGLITGSFYVKYMRYMLPLYPFLVLAASDMLIAFLSWSRKHHIGRKSIVWTLLANAAIILTLAGTLFQGLALLNVYSQPNTRVQASLWLYQHIRPNSVFTYEQWDDPLPVCVDHHDPFLFPQLVYNDPSGQPANGLDLYGADTLQKAHQLAQLLPTVDVLTMATDRLDKSIPRLPARYPLTIHYYQLLFSGQLGFHLAAEFQNHPNLFGITFNDSGADESYSVFDHPTVRIFVRDTPYPYTETQLFQLLMTGVRLP